MSPAYLERGHGAWVWDADGNKYLDYLMALGPIVLGYGDKEVNAAIVSRVNDGTVFSQMHPLEVEVAETLVRVIPCAEMVRFGKNGSDATSAAVRAARALTKRDRVARCGYHGWHDWYIGSTTRDAGVPAAVSMLTHTFEYNKIETLERLFAKHPGEIAAVIMEPVGVEMPEPGFLEAVRDATHKAGAILIFDEIINGFRVAMGGCHEYLGVMPDLATYGKAMANGMPLAAVVGRREYMKVFDEIFFSGTFGGETASLAACQATIGALERRNVIAGLWRYGGKLSAGINEMIERYALKDALKLIGYDVRSILTFPHADERASRLRRSYFMQECHKRGLLFFGAHLPTAAHGNAELDFTFDVYDQVMALFQRALQANDFEQRMEGEIVEPIFRQP